MKNLHFFIFALLVDLIQSRKLWDSSLPEISAETIQKNTPIQAQKLQITGLSGTLHENFLSQLNNVSEIRIIRNQITDIEPGALCSSKNLKILELDLSGNKNPPTLTNTMFDNCQLDELILKFDYNNPSKIDQNTLANITNLKSLAIDSVKLPHLDKNFLFLQKSAATLTTLVLSNINVNTIDKNVFSDFTNLEELEIVHNIGLTSLPEGLFKGLSKLKRLSLRDNAIKNLSWNEFEGLSGLEVLEIGDNQIESFDAVKIARNMPKLARLAMEINSVGCTEEQNFVRELKEKLKNIDVSSNGSNKLC